MRNRWSLGGLLTALLLLSGALPTLSQSQEKPTGSTKSVRVERCSVKLIDEVILSAERAGVLGQIHVREGARVRELDLLALVKDDIPLATLEIARKEADADIDIRFAQKASEVALAEYEKARDANRRVAATVPEIEVRRALLASEKSRLEIEKAQHVRDVNGLKRDEAEVQWKACRVEAPFAGFVSRVHVSKGATVRPGDPILELVSTDAVKVEGFVSLDEAARLEAGQPVVVEVTLRDRIEGSPKPVEFAGVLVFVDVKATPVENRVRVWAEVKNPDNKLRAGLNAVMSIAVGEGG